MTERADPRVRELILASAGSGKTFRISSRIIELLADGEPPGSIFASTFTRKAAGEILDRVLVRLARAALDADEAAELGGHTAASSDPSFWRDVLRSTVAELHRLDVSTLDAFFVRAVGSFAHDLGLPPGWGIADDPTAARLRSEALEEVLDRVDEGVLVELVRTLHAGDVRRSVHDALAREVDGILDVHRALEPAAPGWKAMRQATGQPPDDLPERAARLAERLGAVRVPTNKSGSPNHHWANALPKLAEQIRTGDWKALLGETLCKAIANAEPGEPATFSRIPVPGEVADVLEEATDLARADLGAELAGRAEAMERLAERYEEAWDRKLMDSGRLRFEDVTRLLTGARPLGGRDDLFYRLDGSTRHLLLDEFQDTSLLQWRALVPLADELVGRADRPTGGTAVVVADPKQSIYGWRGAAPVIVESLGDVYGLPREHMARSWRSSQVVLDAVNRVFTDVHEAPVMTRKDTDADETADWGRAFQPHEAAPRDEPLPGHVVLATGPPKNGEGSDQPGFYRWVADRIRDLHREAPGRSIGVLTRQNDTVARIIFELGRRDVPASEEGGTTLTDSAAVVSVLALLRLADHPGDRLARYHVAATPVGEAVGLTDRTDDRAAERLSHRMRRRLLDDGYGRTLSWLGQALADACDAREARRLRRLIELGYRHDADTGAGAGLRVDDFVRLAEATRAESPAQDPVRVMTVHRSKGLEFDAVVLPELHRNMFGGGRDGSPLAYRPGGTGAVTHAYPPVADAVADLFGDITELQEACRQARTSRVRDALGALYVGMTRARYALHMIVPADGERGPGRARSHGRLLRETLAPASLETGARDGDVLYEDGRSDWSELAPRSETTEGVKPLDAPTHIELRSGAPRTRVLERRSPSSEEGAGAPVDLAFRLGLEGSSESRDRGTLVHAWLETMEWIEDGLAPENELRRIARRVSGGMQEEAVERTRAWLVRSLDEPAVREVLSRNQWPESTTVERELPFLRREGDALVEGFVDRLVLVLEGERVVRADVIDYKTDCLEAGDTEALEARTAYYAPQIGAYRRAVAELYRLEPGAVGGKLVFLEPGVVRVVA